LEADQPVTSLYERLGDLLTGVLPTTISHLIPITGSPGRPKWLHENPEKLAITFFESVLLASFFDEYRRRTPEETSRLA
jgi:hypothetical protein